MNDSTPTPIARTEWYSAEIVWRGSSWRYTAESKDASVVAAGVLKMARADGWTVPRWWQFWRWGEERYESIRREAGEL